MADLSHLGGLKEVEQLDLDNTYPVAKESTFSLPPKGEYILRSPDTFPQAAFGTTKNGDLSVQIDPTIVGPDHEGFTVKFVKVSAKTFERSGKKVSQVGDYLTSLGFRGVISDNEQIGQAIDATAGHTYKAKLDWRGYNKRTGWSVEGMERFPKLEDGTYQSWTIDPSEVGKVDENGRQLRVLANLIIPFGGFIPASE